MSIEVQMISFMIVLFITCGYILYRIIKSSRRPTVVQAARSFTNPKGNKVLLQYYRTVNRPEAMVADGIIDPNTGVEELPYMFFCGPKEDNYDEIDPEIRGILLRASRLEPIDPSDPRHREAGKPGFRHFAREFSTRQNQARGQKNQIVRITREDEDTLNFYRALYAEDMSFYLETINQLGTTSTGGNMVTTEGQRATNFLQSHAVASAVDAKLRGRTIRAKTETSTNIKAVATTLEVDKVGSPGSSHTAKVVSIKRSS